MGTAGAAHDVEVVNSAKERKGDIDERGGGVVSLNRMCSYCLYSCDRARNKFATDMRFIAGH